MYSVLVAGRVCYKDEEIKREGGGLAVAWETVVVQCLCVGSITGKRYVVFVIR